MWIIITKAGTQFENCCIDKNGSIKTYSTYAEAAQICETLSQKFKPFKPGYKVVEYEKWKMQRRNNDTI